MKRKKITVAVSGGFDPIHVGHLDHLEAAKKLGDRLVVILNGDSWLIRKKGRAFMIAEDRKRILEAMRCVDYVYVWNSDQDDVGGALEHLKPDIYANGGDRIRKNVPEVETCRRLGVAMIFGVGGQKTRSSSELLKRYEKMP